MNKSTLLVQVLSCKSIKTNIHRNQLIKLKTRFLNRKRPVNINITIWNKQSVNTFRLLKKFDYIIIEGKINKNTKLGHIVSQRQQKDVIFSVSRIFKYQSLLKNKDIDLFIK